VRRSDHICDALDLPNILDSFFYLVYLDLPSSHRPTTPTSLNRPSEGSPLVTGAWQSRLYKIAVLCYKPSNCNNLRILLVYILSSYRRSRFLRSSTSDLLSTQSSFTNIVPPPFGTVFLHLYALLTVLLVLGWRFFALYKFVITYLLTY